MTEFLEALILGVAQGLTEFLPVSSSGHLEIIKYLFNDDSLAEQSMLTTVVLHFATALSTVFVFRSDIVNLLSGMFSKEQDESRKYIFYILISMIPAVIIGLLFDDIITTFFHRKITLVSIMLLVTGALLILSEKLSFPKKPLTATKAFIIGVAQAIAITPGISRSGATIASSILLGIDRGEAARFSFLMVIPLIFGKMAKDVLSGDLVANMPSLGYLTIGFLSAFLTGIFACTIMINIVKKAKLEWFAFYCFVVGIGLLIYMNLP